MSFIEIGWLSAIFIDSDGDFDLHYPNYTYAELRPKLNIGRGYTFSRDDFSTRIALMRESAHGKAGMDSDR